MKKVSIVIPVYNVEQYLEQCIRSAMTQTLHDIEIICVDDGSTDSSAYILRELAAVDGRIKIITKSNSGYGNTMNIGIDSAEGKYLIFLESDDFILPSMCEELYEVCEKYALDIVKTDYYEFKMKRNEVCSRYRKSSEYDNYNQVLKPIDNKELFFASMYTWTCMYRRDFINKHQIRHHETPGASFQDNGFWFQSLMYCERMYLMNRGFYMYRQDNPNSSIHNREKVYAFSKEYSFIREKVMEYSGDGDKKELLQICAFFNLHHNMISLERVEKKYTEELIQLILDEFEIYRELEAWNVNGLHESFLRKLLICMAERNVLQEKVWAYLDKKYSLYHTLEAFERYILYGAGTYANKALEWLERLKIWNKDILCGVTVFSGQKQEIGGIEIRAMEELVPCFDSSLVILCAKKGTSHYIEMSDNLKKWGATNVIHVDDLVLESFWRNW